MALPFPFPSLPTLPALPVIPEFRLPALLTRIGGQLPQWPLGAQIAVLLNLACQLKLLAGDDLAALEGKHFRITAEDLGGTADFEFRDNRFRPLRFPSAAPDLIFSATVSAYLQLLTRQEDPDTLFFNRRLDIQGDTELGLRIKNMLDAIDGARLRSALHL